MRRTCSIILNVFAGFFFYGAILLGFFEDSSTAFKWGIICFFMVIAMIPLSISFVLMRFRQWKREAGIVLMSASGFTAFLVFTFACIYMTDEFQKMMPQETWSKFSDYPSGVGMILGFAGVGFLLFRTDRTSMVQAQTTEA